MTGWCLVLLSLPLQIFCRMPMTHITSARAMSPCRIQGPMVERPGCLSDNYYTVFNQEDIRAYFVVVLDIFNKTPWSGAHNCSISRDF